MGAGHAGWTRDEWVPLCGEPGRCHDLVDGRNGIGAAEGYRAWIRARDTVSAVTGRPGRRRIGVTLQEATENLRVFADSGWSALEASEAIRAGIRRLTSGSGAEGVEGSVGMDTFDTNCEAVASDKED